MSLSTIQVAQTISKHVNGLDTTMSHEYARACALYDLAHNLAAKIEDKDERRAFLYHCGLPFDDCDNTPARRQSSEYANVCLSR